MTGLHLHFGAGPNQLPEPWQNLNVLHDIRKPLRFETGSARAILAEHVIEHVPFLQGLGFFWECLRVLEPGGVLRVAFPDLSRFLGYKHEDSGEIGYQFIARALDYAEALAKHLKQEHAQVQAARDQDEERSFVRAAMLRMATGWGHQTAWTLPTAAACLLAVGFSTVRAREYGKGQLVGVDGHHRDVGAELAELESTILEATK